MIFNQARRLRDAGILGINQRNVDYALNYNKRELFPRVDDKTITKQCAIEAGIPVPEQYGLIEFVGQIKNLPRFLGKHSEFVIKPAHGSGGEGILVIAGRRNGLYQKSNGRMLERQELVHHITNVLSGLYSLGGHPDQALIEYRVRFDPLFEGITFQGVPDIRIIVLLGVPVMAMVRLPTRLSDGKANLHQGAIGVGVDLRSGRTLSSAVWQNNIIDQHPDTGNPVVDVKIPWWGELLAISSRCSDVTGLGYQGVDLVLDRDKGPLLLEINARPGLNVQIANRAGLLPRLRLVEQSAPGLRSIDERVSFAQTRFEAS